MSQQTIAVGTAANDGTGDTLRSAFTKANANFTELYGQADHPGYVAGNWYPSLAVTAAASSTLSSTTLARLHPFMVSQRITLSDLGAFVSTGVASAQFQLAVFGSDPATKKPSGAALAYTAATLSAATSNSVVSGGLNVNLQLEPGALYFMAAAVDNSGVAFGAWGGAQLSTAFTQGAAALTDILGSSASSANLHYSYSHTFANNLSSLSITPGSVTTNGGTVVRCAHVFFKVGSVP